MKLPRIVLTGTAALALVAGGTAVGAAVTSSPVDAGNVIHGCKTTKATSGGAHTFLLQDVGTRCIRQNVSSVLLA